MVTGNENTIKLIYAIQDITLVVVSNISGTWSKDHNRTFTGFDPDYFSRKGCTNGNAPCVVEGNGNCMITGDAGVLRHRKTFGDGPS
jgi:hypothetical protein